MKEIFKYLGEIKERFDSGGNVIDYIKQLNNTNINSVDSILISYDLQSGSYVRNFDQNPEKKTKYCMELVDRLERLDPFDSFLLMGVGEGITLGNVIPRLKKRPKHVFGIDISWSRIKYAQDFVQRFGMKDVFLSTGNLLEAPFADNSIELVMSNHSLEPNGGREEAALLELYRISSKYVVINEPCYEWASEEAKRRIEKLGYVKDLHKVAQKLGLEIISHELFDNPTNPLNPTSCLIIKKDSVGNQSNGFLACPITHNELIEKDQSYFCPKSLLSYPVIDKIPCLLSENAILTSHFS